METLLLGKWNNDCLLREVFGGRTATNEIKRAPSSTSSSAPIVVVVIIVIMVVVVVTAVLNRKLAGPSKSVNARCVQLFSTRPQIIRQLLQFYWFFMKSRGYNGPIRIKIILVSMRMRILY
jgi:hypothetical protein